MIGGTQDNGTRLRTDNGTIHNQIIGGDGMGTAYSQANTNTVIGSSQGSGIRTNFSNNPPDVFQNWVVAARWPTRRGRRFLHRHRRPARRARSDRPSVLPLHRTRACGAPTMAA